ncbi:hypothetical protein HZA43_00370 [Candidatus Peregrinibacteria bacterium]|nr:hypothetical protein [Candidatus Peregrinibacteria bacterium]
MLVALIPATARAADPIDYSFKYQDLIGDFCNKQTTENKWNIYKTQYCDMEKNMEDEVLRRVAKQLGVKWFFGTVPDVQLLKDIINDRAIAVKKLPPAIQKKDRAELSALVNTLYRQEQVFQWEKDALLAEFKGSEVWANGSLFDSPFDLVSDLNLIEVVLFGSKAVITGPRDVYTWPKNEDEKKEPAPAEELASRANVDDTYRSNTPTEPNGNNGDAAQPPAPDCIPDAALSPSDTNAPKNGTDNPSLETQEPPVLSLSCVEHNGLTFKPFQPATPSASPLDKEGLGDLSPSDQQCPPGSHPRDSGSASSHPEKGDTGGFPPPPSPPIEKNISGSLPVLGINPRPNCPPPGMEIEVNIKGSVQKTCIDWLPCANFNDTRRWLRNNLGVDEKTADAVEAAFCVTVEKVNNPETTYPRDESCIACRIEHINDTLNKIHDQNVSPLVNTTMAFALSNKFGMNVYFNLTVAVKNLFHVVYPGKIPEAQTFENLVAKAQQDAAGKKDPAQQGPPPIINTADAAMSLEEVLTATQRMREKQQAEFKDKIQAIRFGNDTAGQAGYWKTVEPALQALKKSFAGLNQRLLSVASSLKFKEKEKCEN